MPNKSEDGDDLEYPRWEHRAGKPDTIVVNKEQRDELLAKWDAEEGEPNPNNPLSPKVAPKSK